MPGTSWENLTNLPYQLAKNQLKEAARRMQEERWKEQEGDKGHLTAHAAESKPQWGMEPSLLLLPPATVTTYVQVRNGAGIEGRHIEEGKCVYCRTHLQSTHHLLWACEETKKERSTFIEEVKRTAPRATRAMMALDMEPAFHFLMGAGAKTTNTEEWKTFQRRAAQFVLETFGTKEIKPRGP